MEKIRDSYLCHQEKAASKLVFASEPIYDEYDDDYIFLGSHFAPPLVAYEENQPAETSRLSWSSSRMSSRCYLAYSRRMGFQIQLADRSTGRRRTSLSSTKSTQWSALARTLSVVSCDTPQSESCESAPVSCAWSSGTPTTPPWPSHDTTHHVMLLVEGAPARCSMKWLNLVGSFTAHISVYSINKEISLDTGLAAAVPSSSAWSNKLFKGSDGHPTTSSTIHIVPNDLIYNAPTNRSTECLIHAAGVPRKVSDKMVSDKMVPDTVLFVISTTEDCRRYDQERSTLLYLARPIPWPFFPIDSSHCWTELLWHWKPTWHYLHLTYMRWIACTTLKDFVFDPGILIVAVCNRGTINCSGFRASSVDPWPPIHSQELMYVCTAPWSLQWASFCCHIKECKVFCQLKLLLCIPMFLIIGASSDGDDSSSVNRKDFNEAMSWSKFSANEIIHQPSLTSYPDLMVKWQKVKCSMQGSSNNTHVPACICSPATNLLSVSNYTYTVSLTNPCYAPLSYTGMFCPATGTHNKSGCLLVSLAFYTGTSLILECMDTCLFERLWPHNLSIFVVSNRVEELLCAYLSGYIEWQQQPWPSPGLLESACASVVLQALAWPFFCCNKEKKELSDLSLWPPPVPSKSMKVQLWTVNSVSAQLSGLPFGPYMRRQWDPGIHKLTIQKDGVIYLIAIVSATNGQSEMRKEDSEPCHDYKLVSLIQIRGQMQNEQQEVCRARFRGAWGQAPFRRGGNVTTDNMPLWAY